MYDPGIVSRQCYVEDLRDLFPGIRSIDYEFLPTTLEAESLLANVNVI